MGRSTVSRWADGFRGRHTSMKMNQSREDREPLVKNDLCSVVAQFTEEDRSFTLRKLPKVQEYRPRQYI